MAEQASSFRWSESLVIEALKNTQEQNHYRGRMYLNKKLGGRNCNDQSWEHKEVGS